MSYNNSWFMDILLVVILFQLIYICEFLNFHTTLTSFIQSLMLVFFKVYICHIVSRERYFCKRRRKEETKKIRFLENQTQLSPKLKAFFLSIHIDFPFRYSFAFYPKDFYAFTLLKNSHFVIFIRCAQQTSDV
jgi:hypothetical protein